MKVLRGVVIAQNFCHGNYVAALPRPLHTSTDEVWQMVQTVRVVLVVVVRVVVAVPIVAIHVIENGWQL